MGNVTDSLNRVGAVLAEVEARLRYVNERVTLQDSDYFRASEELGGQLLELQVELGDVQDIIRREKAALGDKGSLFYRVACTRCGETFLTIPGGGREPLYCSASCRQASYRARKRRRLTGDADRSQ